MTPDFATHESVDRALSVMGTHVRIVVGEPCRDGLPDASTAADRVADLLVDYDRRLSRFRRGSELCALNADPRDVVPASGLLRDAVRAALDAAAQTAGLVDPVLLDEVEAAGYRESWDKDRRVPLADALAETTTPRQPASPRPEATWRSVRIDDAAGTITRPPGLRLDNGGSGKGHAADLAAELLAGYESWAIDCGGDLRIGGDAGVVRDVEVEDPFTGRTLEVVRVRRGAVATSGLRSRIWRNPDGSIAHHLIDPATGSSAFTGLVAVTALAPTAVTAEALAKASLLSGPAGAERMLLRHGGIAVTEEGRAIRVGRLEPPPLVRVRMPAGRAA